MGHVVILFGLGCAVLLVAGVLTWLNAPQLLTTLGLRVPVWRSHIPSSQPPAPPPPPVPPAPPGEAPQGNQGTSRGTEPGNQPEPAPAADIIKAVSLTPDQEALLTALATGELAITWVATGKPATQEQLAKLCATRKATVGALLQKVKCPQVEPVAGAAGEPEFPPQPVEVPAYVDPNLVLG